MGFALLREKVQGLFRVDLLQAATFDLELPPTPCVVHLSPEDRGASFIDEDFGVRPARAVTQ